MTTMPPLLQIAEGRKPRVLQRMAQFRPRESALQFQVAKLLRNYALPAWRWSHFPAGEHRDKRTAGKLKAMGLQRGWADFLLFSPAAILHALELKRVGENLTCEQEAFRDWCAEHGAPFAVAKSIDEALAAFEAWGALRIKIGGAA